MKNHATKAVAAAKIATAVESATAAKDSCNLVPLHHSLLPSPPLPTMLLSAPKKSPPQSPECGGLEKKRSEKKIGFGRYVGATIHRIKMLRGTVSTQTGPPPLDPFAGFQHAAYLDGCRLARSCCTMVGWLHGWT
jgi:hypothetical protein